MADRLDRARSDDQSCTDRPCSVSGVELATIPETMTFPLGVAMVGLRDVIAIHGCAGPGWLAAAVRTAPAPAPGAAAAGTVASHPTPTAAATAAATSRSHRRAVLARGSTPPPRGQAPGPHGPEPPAGLVPRSFVTGHWPLARGSDR